MSAPELFLIEKRGFYYRPDAAGYTGLKEEAGRYSFEEAAERVGPNGPDGPRDGLGMWRESEAPEYSSACPWDVKMKRESYLAGYSAARDDLCTPTDERVKALEAENARLRKALSIYADVVSAYASDCELTSDPAYDWLQDDGGNVARAALRDMGVET